MQHWSSLHWRDRCIWHLPPPNLQCLDWSISFCSHRQLAFWRDQTALLPSGSLLEPPFLWNRPWALPWWHLSRDTTSGSSRIGCFRSWGNSHYSFWRQTAWRQPDRSLSPVGSICCASTAIQRPAEPFTPWPDIKTTGISMPVMKKSGLSPAI